MVTVGMLIDLLKGLFELIMGIFKKDDETEGTNPPADTEG